MRYLGNVFQIIASRYADYLNMKVFFAHPAVLYSPCHNIIEHC